MDVVWLTIRLLNPPLPPFPFPQLPPAALSSAVHTLSTQLLPPGARDSRCLVGGVTCLSFADGMTEQIGREGDANQGRVRASLGTLGPARGFNYRPAGRL